MSRGRRQRRDRGGLLPGVIMIVVGTLFLLQRFDVVPVGRVWQFWPLILIGFGLMNLVRPERGHPSIFLLLLGIWLQISTLDLFGLDFRNSWPLLIVFVGVSFVFDSLVSGGRGRHDARDDVIEVDAVHGGDDGR